MAPFECESRFSTYFAASSVTTFAEIVLDPILFGLCTNIKTSEIVVMELADAVRRYRNGLKAFLRRYYTSLLQNYPPESLNSLYALGAKSTYDTVFSGIDIRSFLFTHWRRTDEKMCAVLSTNAKEYSKGLFHCCMKVKLKDTRWFLQLLIVQAVPEQISGDGFLVTEEYVFVDDDEPDLQKFSLNDQYPIKNLY